MSESTTGISLMTVLLVLRDQRRGRGRRQWAERKQEGSSRREQCAYHLSWSWVSHFHSSGKT
jgi:hypothetical protein